MLATLPYTAELKQAVGIAQSLAREYRHATFSPAHLLRAVLHPQVGLVDFLETLGKDVYYMQEWAEVRLELYPKSGHPGEAPPGDEAVARVLDEADLIRVKLAREEVDPIGLLAALCKPNAGFTAEQLKSFPLTQQELFEATLEAVSLQDTLTAPAASPDAAPPSGKVAAAKALYKYCVDKTSLAREGKLDPIIGRDRETRMVAEILGRRTKPNVLIVGEPGVGKTALVDGFARNITGGQVPAHLHGALIFELDLGALVAGASYKGEVEDRLKNIIKEIKQFDRAILFIDEIHALVDPKGNFGAGAANLLKPELARGELTVIGATTNDEYRRIIESEEAFNRRFEVVRVEEPDVETAYRMMRRLMPFYEKHHGLKVTDEAAMESVRLARRYIKDRRLPDAAIDLMDRTMAGIRMMGDTARAELEALDAELVHLAAVLPADDSPATLKELRWFHQQMRNKVNPLVLGRLEEDADAGTTDSPEGLADYLKNTIGLLKGLTADKKDTVEPNDVAAVVSHKTGIPLGKIQTKEREKLLNMDEHLRRRVVGQDHAIKALSEAILESRSGLTKAGQPIGSFFLLGPTGTGKTELAKSLADFLFNDEQFLIRFDMSEFKEEHSAALLYGAPPGYVGYEEGGLLVNKIREKPFAVVLFDEIEKAHPSVFDIFLQILDEGKLHDRLGREGDFSNAVILFTSNIGSDYVVEKFGAGQTPSPTDLLDIMTRYFRPEFLGRLTEIVPFAPITEENVVKIFNIHAQGLLKTLEKQGITLTITPAATKHLALMGFTPKYGARPLTGVIRNQLRRPLSKLIIAGALAKGATVTVDVDEKGRVITNY